MTLSLLRHKRHLTGSCHANAQRTSAPYSTVMRTAVEHVGGHSLLSQVDALPVSTPTSPRCRLCAQGRAHSAPIQMHAQAFSPLNLVLAAS